MLIDKAPSLCKSGISMTIRKFFTPLFVAMDTVSLIDKCVCVGDGGVYRINYGDISIQTMDTVLFVHRCFSDKTLHEKKNGPKVTH